jgi:hypothetical protein
MENPVGDDEFVRLAKLGAPPRLDGVPNLSCVSDCGWLLSCSKRPGRYLGMSTGS